MKVNAENFIIKYMQASKLGKRRLKGKGIRLAHLLHSEAVDLATMKATEFHPDIETTFLKAAKIAYLVMLENPAKLDLFEKNIYYYKNFETSLWVVEEYETFKTSISVT